MFTTIYNYFYRVYYNSNKNIKINEEVYIKNHIILRQNVIFRRKNNILT